MFPAATVLITFLLSLPAAFASASTAKATPPQKIASATIASDEIVLDILQHAGQLSRLHAVSYLADDPRYSNIAEKVKPIPARVGLNVEALLSLKPDLVILASFNRPELRTQLSQSKIKVYTLSGFDTLADISSHIRGLGSLLEEKKAGEEVARKFESDLARLNARMHQALTTHKRRTPIKVLNWHDDGIFLGSGTMFHSMVAHLGAENEAARSGLKGWGRLSEEVVAGLKPEWLIIPGSDADLPRVLKALQQKPAYANLPAVKQQRLIMIPSAELQALSPHIISAMEKITRHLEAGL